MQSIVQGVFSRYSGQFRGKQVSSVTKLGEMKRPPHLASKFAVGVAATISSREQFATLQVHCFVSWTGDTRSTRFA
jgi:hypothetical protein